MSAIPAPIDPPEAIVCVGCAAGGVVALKQFFAALPKSFQAAVVVIQHAQESDAATLREILARSSSLPVYRLDGQPTPLELGRVYLAPPQSTVSVDPNGVRAIHEDEPRRRAAVVDSMFQTFAQYDGMPIAGVVLSGRGGDGTLGLKAIGDAGGMTLAQDPESSEQNEMPRAAALGGNADHVLPPAGIAAELISYLEHLRYIAERDQGTQEAEDVEAILPRLCELLLEVTDCDFRHYKSRTMIRRVMRRMQVQRCRTADEYVQRVKSDRDEARALFRELLISVTGFFRDPDAFAVLSRLVIPELIATRDPQRPIRIWVPGCATGQEAYTLAMLMCEAIDELPTGHDPVQVQIFATDIDARALALARAGDYPLSIADELTDQRLERFFTRAGGKYSVIKRLREMCVFAMHNLISDPPFSQLDLISCRNLLIYLGDHLQLKLVPLFHYALRPHGYLMLGPAENLSSHSEIFRSLDQQHRISQRKPGPAQQASVSSRVKTSSPKGVADAAVTNEIDVHRVSQRIVLDEFAPRYVVVDEDGKLICNSTGLEPYVRFIDGPFHNNVLQLVRPSLRSGLRAAFREALEELRMVVRDDLLMTIDDGAHRIKLVVQPMPEIGEQRGLFMIVFDDLGSVNTSPSTIRSPLDQAGSNDAVEQLERELERTRTELEGALKDLERSNEELKSSNEELRSLNEELQSANEELETSKEEIQSSVEALSMARSDLQNLLEGTKIATIFLDHDGVIKSFTPSVAEIFNVKEGDLGRPLGDITSRAKVMPPLPSAESLTSAESVVEDQICFEHDRWYHRRVLPYHRDNLPVGMIVTFVNITEQKLAELRLAAAHQVSQSLIAAESFEQAMPELLTGLRNSLEVDVSLLWLLDETTDQLNCVCATAFDESTGADEFIQSSRCSRVEKGHGLPGAAWESNDRVWLDELAGERADDRVEFAHDAGLMSGVGVPIQIGRKCVGVVEFYSTQKLPREGSLLDLLSDVGREIGHFLRRDRLVSRLHEERGRAEALVEASSQMIWSTTPAGLVEEDSKSWRDFTGQSYEQWTGTGWLDALHPDDRAQTRSAWQEAVRTVQPFSIQYRVRHHSGEWRWTAARGVPQLKPDGSVRRWVGMNTDITEQRQLQQTISEREKRYAMALRAGDFAAWEWTPEASYWSDALYELLDLSKERVPCPETFFECVHPDDVEGLIRAWDLATDGTAPYDTEFRIVNGVGEIRWIAGVGEVERDESGNVISVYGLNWDITTQHETEATLRESEAFLRRTLDSLVTFVGVCLPDGTIEEVNQPALRTANLTIDDVRGVRFWEAYWFCHDEQVARQVEDAVSKAAGGKASRFDVEIRVGDERFLAIDFQLVPMWNERGEITHLVASAIDVSERKRIQEELAVLAAIAEQSGDFVAIATIDGRGIFLNPAGRTMVGLPPDQSIEELSIADFFAPEDVADVQEHIGNVIASGSHGRDLRFQHFQTGELIDVYWNVFRIDDPVTGEPFALGTITQDIRERKKSELILRDARRAAEAANQAKSEFLANMSHEIRTPMAAILGYADVLLGHLQDPDNRTCVHIVKKNGDYLLELINDILDLSRIEAGKLEIDVERCDLPAFTTDIQTLMHVRAVEKELEFEVAFTSDVPKWIETDPVRLRQVLINLLGNAIKFTDDGRVTLNVSSRELNGLRTIEFEVSDTGIGMSDEQLARLFKPFSQGDSSITRSYGGSGLGLAISERLVEMLGGELRVQSAVGVGSRFCVTVPIEKEECVEMVSAQTVALRDATKTVPAVARRLTCRVLVVDDRRDVRHISQHFLEKAGADVATAEDGQEGIDAVCAAIAAERPFEIIVMDMQMPKLDGLEATAQLRARGIETPIIALTADAMKGDRERCLNGGCDDYLSKPIDHAALVDIVARYTIDVPTEQLRFLREQRAAVLIQSARGDP